jgi:hypothetical protein
LGGTKRVATTSLGRELIFEEAILVTRSSGEVFTLKLPRIIPIKHQVYCDENGKTQ